VSVFFDAIIQNGRIHPRPGFYIGLSLLFPALSSKNATGGKTHGASSFGLICRYNKKNQQMKA
jgi:hypothetical protein